MPTTPNILYLHSHDTGRWIQPYGYDVPTPHLQHLAEQGILFRRAFCGSPTCSASRSCLLTGAVCHSPANGVMGLANRGFPLRDPGKHLIHTLRHAGYESHLLGVQHVMPDRAQIGYDVLHDPGGTDAHRLGPYAAKWIAEEAPTDKPWFASVGFIETHRQKNWGHTGHVGDDPTVLRGNPAYRRPPPPLADRPELRQEWADFGEAARMLDTAIGQILEAIDHRGLADNTLVIYTTDHGPAYPRMKCNVTDLGLGVSLIIRGPGGFDGGREIESLISHCDIFPTLCDLLDIDPPAWLEGVSLMPCVIGEQAEVREQIFAETNVHGGVELTRCIRTDRFKLIRRFDHGLGPADRIMTRNCDDSPAKKFALERGWSDQRWDTTMLYDLDLDPFEQCNLAENTRYHEIQTDLEQRLIDWMRQTSDPVLDGSFRLPVGALVNDADGHYMLQVVEAQP